MDTKTKITADAIFSDGSGSNKEYINDGLYKSTYTSTAAECYIGYDAGAGKKIKVNRIRYFPSTEWLIASEKLQGAIFEASNSETTGYTPIFTVDQTVHAGWNSYIPDSFTTPYRYVRMKHTSDSKCELAEFEIHGVVVSDETVANIVSHTIASAIFDDGHNTFTFANAIEYRQDKTPKVNTVAPRNGDVFGGYTITLAGENLDAGTATIMIDGVACAVQSAGAAQIVC